MKVATILPKALERHVRTVLRGIAVRPTSASRLVRDPAKFAGAIIDPHEVEPSSLADVAKTLPVLLYADRPTPTAARAVVSTRGLTLYRHYEGTPPRLRRAVAALTKPPESARALLRAWNSHLNQLDPDAQHAVAALFQHPFSYRTVDELAAESGHYTRWLYRQFEAAGFVSPRAVLLAARVAWIYGWMREAPAPLHQVARKAGYRDYHRFVSHVLRATGLRPSVLRKKSLEHVVVLLTRHAHSTPA